MEVWPVEERVTPFDETIPGNLADAFLFARELQKAVDQCAGIIIVILRKGRPTSYRGELGFGTFEETSSEDPKLYRTPRGLLRALTSYREEAATWIEPPEAVMPALWVHPDYYAMPRAKYLDMRARFPGSPRR